jgi:hypothetical protein
MAIPTSLIQRHESIEDLVIVLECSMAVCI